MTTKRKMILWFAGFAVGASAQALSRPLYVVSNPAVEPKIVWRFWSPVGRCHFYTISERERDKLREKYADKWTFEGPAFMAYPVPVEPNQ